MMVFLFCFSVTIRLFESSRDKTLHKAGNKTIDVVLCLSIFGFPNDVRQQQHVIYCCCFWLAFNFVIYYFNWIWQSNILYNIFKLQSPIITIQWQQQWLTTVNNTQTFLKCPMAQYSSLNRAHFNHDLRMLCINEWYV